MSQRPLTQSGAAVAKHLTGFKLIDDNANLIVITRGFCRDQSNKCDLASNVDLLLNTGESGVNGLDTGTIAADTLYYIYVIGDSARVNPTACIMSVANPAIEPDTQEPLFPFGYDMCFRIGAVFTNALSMHRSFAQTGAGHVREMWYQNPIQLITNGSNTAETDFNITPYIPRRETAIKVKASLVPSAAGETLILRNSSTAINGESFTMSACVAGVDQIVQGSVPTGVPVGSTIQCRYKVSNVAAVSNVWLVAYNDLLIN